MTMARQHSPRDLRVLGGGLTAMGFIFALMLVLGQLGAAAAGADPGKGQGNGQDKKDAGATGSPEHQTSPTAGATVEGEAKGKVHDSEDADVEALVNVKAKANVRAGLSASSDVTSQAQGKVTICHATSSVKNPYVQITVAVSAVDGTGGGDHFGEHKGPVFNAAIHEQGDDWGDIIPPVAGVHGGLNWDVQGQAILRAGCMFAPVTTTTTVPVATTTTEVPTTTTEVATTTTEVPTTTTEAATTTTEGGASVLGETAGPGGGANVRGQGGALAFTGGLPVALAALSALFLLSGTAMLRFARRR
jgi:hypothetical protein